MLQVPGDSFGAAPRRDDLDVEEVGDVSLEFAATAAALVSDLERVAPAAYNPSGDMTCISSCPSAPRWTISGRHSTGSINKVDRDSGPGPKYKIDVPRSSRGPRFGTRTVDSSGGRTIFGAASESPGPAQYDTRRAKEPKHIRGGVVGQDNRVRSAAKANTPGPGSYANHSTLNQGGTAIGQAQVNRGSHFSGPGSDSPEARRGFYTTQRPTSAPPSWSFGHGKRRGQRDIAGDAPLYNPPSTLSGRAAASCRNGAVPPDSSAFEVRPDPSTYCTDKPDASIAQSFARATRPMSAGPLTSSNVGPGSYPKSSAAHISTMTSLVCSTKIATSHSQSRLPSGPVELAPGPGAYNVTPGRKQTAFGFGKAPRTPGAPPPSAVGPGPGSYGGSSGPTRPSSAGSGRGPKFASRKDAPSAAARGRASPAPSVEVSPGPGSHDLAAAPCHHSGWTFGTGGRTASRQQEVVADKPGPGAYNPAPSGGALSTSTTRFTRSQMMERSAELSASGLGPGPGAYKSYSAFV